MTIFRVLALLAFLGAATAHFAAKNIVHEQLTAEVVHEKHTSSWFTFAKEKKNGVLGVVALGCLCWCLCPIWIFNTERISAKQAKMRFKAQRYAVHLDDPELEPFDDLEGRIVYITGNSTCSAKLKDDVFTAVESDGKIKLRRQAEMYQNVEHSREEGDGDHKRTVYYYTQEWSDHHERTDHDSSMRNPSFPFPSTRRQDPYQAAAISGSGENCVAADHTNVRLGKYYLDDFVIREMRNWKVKEGLTDKMLTYKSSVLSSSHSAKQGSGDWWYFDGEGKTGTIGQMRVRFEELHTGPITICGVLAKNQKGWSFLPIVNQQAQGTCDSLVVECGGSCCFSVEELHYDDADNKELQEQLKDREKEMEKSALKSLKRKDTMQESIEDDNSDLCCACGPMGMAVKEFMNYIGLEDELLAVKEEERSLNGLMKDEEEAMQEKVNMARMASFFGLMLATWMIISPVMKLLNYNWLVTMMGGGLLSCLICCCAMAFTCSAYSCLISSAWIWYRPFLGLVAAAFSIIMMICVIYCCMEGYKEYEKGQAGRPPPGSYAFLAMHETWNAFSHHM